MSVSGRHSGKDDISLRPERPFGVTALTIIDGFYAGLWPMMGAISSLTSASTNEGMKISWLALWFSIGLPITIITAAIGAYKGYDRARFWLLVLITTYFSLNTFQDLSLVSVGIYSRDMTFSAYGRILRSGVWLLLNIWYFLRSGTIAYYRRPLQS
jgi:hypothetical protein